jgi:hypothetical protein
MSGDKSPSARRRVQRGRSVRVSRGLGLLPCPHSEGLSQREFPSFRDDLLGFRLVETA